MGLLLGENSQSSLPRTPELCISIFLFNKLVRLTHNLADKSKASLFKLCRVVLIKAIFIFLNFILFKITLESDEAGASYKPTNTSQ